MSYIGNTVTTQGFTPAVDYFSGNASTTAFTLSRPVASVAQVQAVIENVPQNPGSAFTVSGSTITFTSAPPSGTNNIYVYYTSPITQINPLTQSPSLIGAVQTTQGFYATGSYTVGYSDGIVMDYTTGLGRFSVGASDGIAFYNGGVANTYLFGCDFSGNFGIGTSSPNKNLETVGTIRVSRPANPSTYMEFFGGSGSFDPYINVPSGFGIPFRVNASEVGRFDSSGNLLVGATTYGGAGLSLAKPDSSGCFSVFAAGGTGYHSRFGNVTNGIVGSITTTTSATSFNPSSDRRLKENIKPMTDGLARVMKLKPVTYNWITDGSEDDGFIAQDLQMIPEFERRVNPIDERDGETYYGVDYMRFVSVLTAAIQEQQAIITSLTERITALENK